MHVKATQTAQKEGPAFEVKCVHLLRMCVDEGVGVGGSVHFSKATKDTHRPEFYEAL